jgi:hypothetical protein
MTQAPDVLIPLGDEFLVLSHDQFAEALRKGRALGGGAISSEKPVADRVLDAEGMEAETKIPASWFLGQARRGNIPHLRAGKYVRFQLAAVLDALRNDPRYTDHYPYAPERPKPARSLFGAGGSDIKRLPPHTRNKECA